MTARRAVVLLVVGSFVLANAASGAGRRAKSKSTKSKTVRAKSARSAKTVSRPRTAATRARVAPRKAPGKRSAASTRRIPTPQRRLAPTTRKRALTTKKRIAPATRRIAPATKRIAPATKKRVASATKKRVAPATKRIAPATKRIAPATKRIAPATKKLAPATKKLAPATKKLAPRPVRKQPYVKRGVVELRGRLNLRSGPGMDFPPISQLNGGTSLTTLERSANTMTRPDRPGQHRWYKVSVGGKTGWVWGGYVNLGGTSAAQRNLARSPSMTPAEAKAKGRVNLPKAKLDSLRASYQQKLQAGALRPKTRLPNYGAPGSPAQQSPTQQSPTQQSPMQQSPVQHGQAAVSVPLPKGFQAYSQGDPRWKTTKIGTSENRTIGQVGCALTSWAMLGQFYGKRYTPEQLNNILKKNGAYSGASLNMPVVAKSLGFQLEDTRDVSKGWQANQNKALDAIRENFSSAKPKPMMMQVDYNSDTDKAGNHFVVVTGVTASGDPIIYDPGASANQGVPLSQVKTHGGYVPLRALAVN